MRMEQLHYLVDVAETNSMTKTAERLFVSPQAVSKAIKQLEEELGTELLIRTRLGVRLTNVGESIVALAQNMILEEQLMEQIVAQKQKQSYSERQFPLRIYSTSAISSIIIPDVIARFQDANVNILPHVSTVESWKELFDSVRDGACDLGIITYNKELLFHNFASYQNELDMKLLASDELVVAMKAHSRYMDEEYLTADTLKQHLFTMFSIMPVETVDVGDVVNVARSNDADFHRAMILRTDAVTIMPRIAYQYFFSSKRYIALPLQGYETQVLHAAVYRKDASDELRNFVSMMRLKLR